ncbi:MAG: hypothetical protein GY803_20965 [Chloroflexi bacterium]|nr:hypothetical protein [Chloroflexota bacterium]
MDVLQRQFGDKKGSIPDWAREKIDAKMKNLTSLDLSGGVFGGGRGRLVDFTPESAGTVG